MRITNFSLNCLTSLKTVGATVLGSKLIPVVNLLSIRYRLKLVLTLFYTQKKKNEKIRNLFHDLRTICSPFLVLTSFFGTIDSRGCRFLWPIVNAARYNKHGHTT